MHVLDEKEEVSFQELLGFGREEGHLTLSKKKRFIHL